MSVAATSLRCDVCGVVAASPDGKFPGWVTQKFRPGILRRTKPRPDVHACSAKCQDELAKRDEAELKALDEAVS